MFCFQTETLRKFGELGVFCFARHPRLGYWTYNMLQQKRIFSRGNFYINHNFGKHLPAVDELCEMLHSNSYTSLIRKYSIML